MASIVVVIELVGGRPHPGSLEVLGQGRRIGSQLGATVYAVLPCATSPDDQDDGALAILSRGGADKVLIGVSPAHAASPRWGTHGAIVMAACTAMPPSLLLLAETQGGRELGARAAARLGAALLVDAWIEVEGDDLALWRGSGADACRLDAELDFAVVALVPPGRYPPAHGDEEAEVELLDLLEPNRDFVAQGDVLPGAPSLVIGAGAAAERLATALGGVTVGAASNTTSGSVPGDAPWPAPIAVALQDHLDGVRAERTVLLGPDAGVTAPHYVVDARPGQSVDDLADELARALDQVRDKEPDASPAAPVKP